MVSVIDIRITNNCNGNNDLNWREYRRGGVWGAEHEGSGPEKTPGGWFHMWGVKTNRGGGAGDTSTWLGSKKHFPFAVSV